MTQTGCWGGPRKRGLTNGLWAVGVLMVAGISQAAAAECEVRDFTIHVDGKKAGTYQMAIGIQDNGVIIMTGKADVSLRYLVYSYTYSYRGKEVWKGGSLQSFASSTNDNGKKFQVTAEPENNGLRVKVSGANNRQYLARADMWPTSYWQLPPAKYRNGGVSLMDGDTGKPMAGQLRYIGQERLTVAGQQQNCFHYRVTGTPSPVDLWYDGQERLVRQDYMDDGHRTVLEATSIRK
jgi:hypothetical protein